ncbi:uncharacterized protein A1O9_11779 [Exophiala aquamarina CBS 119918]|uniref:F-box domain-containing protein n=1 Tax=Exophiala aquamarina CBS 119918 TaxID=1182545 RepID=A0A072NYQ4_9EURO|nr:uncharacterized protein A1O9_11779 [Exophiala aquamarina CBS 119918]KEF52153.1 hypothetical protein A1O9_11779 [Exophiala aquamarina CBS 119918]
MLDTLPQETFQQVLCLLQRRDLKALRLVNVAFSRDVSKVLFRSIDISCLTLHRLPTIGSHPILAPLVEDIYYHEMEMDIVGPSASNLDTDLRYLWQNIHQFRKECDMLGVNWKDDENVMAYRLHGSEMLRPSSSAFDSTPSSSMPLQFSNEAEFEAMMITVLDVYAQYARQQELKPLSETFCQYMPLLPRLRRFVSIDTSAGEIARNYPFTEGFSQLDPIQQLFPLSDAAIRYNIAHYSDDWPGHGFIAMLATLDACADLKIQHLEMCRAENLWSKRGIAYYKVEEMKLSLGMNPQPRAFQTLETLNLCLEMGLLEYSAWHFVPSALAMAKRLKVLEICLTARAYSSAQLQDILPSTCLPSLHTVVFEGFSFITLEITHWLFLQPKLRNLKLRKCRLEGCWKDLLDKLSENPTFKLDSFELKSPWDRDNEEYELGRLEDTQVPSRVSNEGALYFINEGGQNPFVQRRWRRFATDSNDDGNWGNKDLDGNLSDYSDLSEWRAEDHPTPVEDFDGLEYDENYNSDAGEEESDIETGGNWNGIA